MISSVLIIIPCAGPLISPARRVFLSPLCESSRAIRGLSVLSPTHRSADVPAEWYRSPADRRHSISGQSENRSKGCDADPSATICSDVVLPLSVVKPDTDTDPDPGAEALQPGRDVTFSPALLFL